MTHVLSWPCAAKRSCSGHVLSKHTHLLPRKAKSAQRMICTCYLNHVWSTRGARWDIRLRVPCLQTAVPLKAKRRCCVGICFRCLLCVFNHSGRQALGGLSQDFFFLLICSKHLPTRPVSKQLCFQYFLSTVWLLKAAQPFASCVYVL